MACRDNASLISLSGMPGPLSETLISLIPPSTIEILISSAPESILFSINSLSADEGRSTTSPAAIWLIRMSDNGLMLGMVINGTDFERLIFPSCRI